VPGLGTASRPNIEAARRLADLELRCAILLILRSLGTAVKRIGMQFAAVQEGDVAVVGGGFQVAGGWQGGVVASIARARGAIIGPVDYDRERSALRDDTAGGPSPVLPGAAPSGGRRNDQTPRTTAAQPPFSRPATLPPIVVVMNQGRVVGCGIVAFSGRWHCGSPGN
jgi:hypothetical protein